MSNFTQRSFAGGEISSLLFGRSDIAKYATGLRTCRNMIVLKHGAVVNRAGTRHINETKGSERTRLVPWEYDMDTTFLLEFTDGFIRFYKDEVLVMTPGEEPEDPDVIYELVSPYVEAELPYLQFVQNKDVMTITSALREVYELRSVADDDWTIAEKVYGASIAPPTTPVATGTAGGIVYLYFITSIDAVTGEESLPQVSNAPVLQRPSETTKHTVTWGAVTGAVSYNVYVQAPDNESSMGFIGNATSASFVNTGIQPDFLYRPPAARIVFQDTTDFPSVVTYYQQRLLLANLISNPVGVFTSRSARFNNFYVSSPVQDDDAITFSMAGRKVNPIRHMIDIGKLVVFTENGEWTIEGDDAGIIRPAEINPRQYSHNGCNHVPPVVVNDTVLYVQARGKIVRDLINDSKALIGNDLTLFATHLFKDTTIVDLDYQQSPDSVVWAVRSDGVLLGLTYVREQGVWAWHRHDTDGLVEDICVLAEADEDVLYMVVNRDGARFIERLALRGFDDIADAYFMDCGVSFDFSEEEEEEDQTVDTVLVPWLAGMDVSVLADGLVLSSPNNPNVPTLTVGLDGVLELPNLYGKIHVGLPFVSDFGTLDIDTANGPSIKTSRMLVNRVNLYVEKTKGLFIGERDAEDADLTEGLEPSEDYNTLTDGVIAASIEAEWNQFGRVFVRQLDPLPVTILSSMPQGKLPRAA